MSWVVFWCFFLLILIKNLKLSKDFRSQDKGLERVSKSNNMFKTGCMLSSDAHVVL